MRATESRSMNAFVAATAVLILLAPAIPAAAQEGPPPASPMEPVSFPDHTRRTLSNGAEVIVVENHEQPVVTVNLRIKSGSAYDPAPKAGLAGMTATLLDKGTTSRSAREIAEAADFIGASLGASAGDDWTSATTTVLTEFLDQGLELLADVVVNPTFPADELETERKRQLSALQVELSQPSAVASRQFLGGLYGDHPYGFMPTEESTRAIQRPDLVEFHDTHYRPDNALFVVAGDVDPDDILERLEAHFGDWAPGAPSPIELPEPPARSERQIRLYHKPGSVQAVVRVGHLMEPAVHPDWVPLDVAIRILGGGSQGWLYETLRGEKGYTYGAYAGASKRNDYGYFQANAEVRNEVTDSAMSEMFRLLEVIREEPVPEEDLQLAKDYITGSFPRRIETPQQVASQIATTRLRGLPEDYLETYRERVAAVDRAEVQRVASEHIHPEDALVVAVGDATAIRDMLAPFGPVSLYNVEGESITMADLEVKASEVAFDPSIIEGATLVYTLSFQGNPIGNSTLEVVRESRDGRDGREVIRSTETAEGMGFSTSQQAVFDATTFRAISSSSAQQARGTTIETDLTLSDGTVSGTVSGGPAGDQQVEAEVPDGTILPGMDTFVIWLAELGEGTTLTVPAFNAQSGNTYNLEIEVTGDTTVTVPAGEFAAYEVEINAAQASLTAWVRAEAPHYVLRQEFAGQPIVLELKEIR